MATKLIYISDDNGQMACDEHKDFYGRIPWHRLSASEQISMRAELSDIKGPNDSLCEICTSNERRAKANVGGAAMTSERNTAPTEEVSRAEAETRAHDRVSPDAILNSIAAVNLFVEAFLDGAQFADDRHEATR